ncbi:lectin [Actinoplanes oblitus]|uniref:Alpha-galactosidase n=1 Tax=Actinoplanes oblitus TaxID=3040509 RepID=A0ABY8W736_9ACTN|nr:lectin [Actinoplanes oblitus]WIM92832.1 lectin [Actinoplanes oblitus]
MRKTLRSVLSALLVAVATPVALAAAQPAQALESGLARTPQLGWNDWNSFGCNVSDTLIRQTADAMVSSGMAAAGYRYVNIDDCWSQRTRNGSGDLVPDPQKFPNGMKALADYVHGKGLKIGIYSSAGLTTCAGYPASLNNEQRDAKLWASWGIDYLKYDNCGDTQGKSGQQRYTAMRDALATSGRPILFAICNWGTDSVGSWGPATGNSWRTTGDIAGNWNSVMGILDSQPGWMSYSKPGAWNDPDMLEVGNGLSDTESRAHFSLWAVLNAPLIAGNDLRTMSAATKAILTNTEVIGVNQDWGGRQGNRIADNGNSEVWAKPMANGSAAVVLLNRASSTATVSTTAAQLGLGGAASYSVRDLWAHTTSTTGSTISASVPAHGAAMYLVTGGTGSTTGTFALRGSQSGRCLDVPNGNQTNGTPLAIWDCNGGGNQQWTATAAGELRTSGGKCLDVTGAATADGTRVEVWDCNGQANQRWQLQSNGTVTAAGAGKCLDVYANGTANGTAVEIWSCNGGANQQWTRG